MENSVSFPRVTTGSPNHNGKQVSLYEWRQCDYRAIGRERTDILSYELTILKTTLPLNFVMWVNNILIV